MISIHIHIYDEFHFVFRNLLAHINLNHQREIRYRCKNCPLTFLKKKAFIYHHREKHKEAVEPWCTLCLEVFDGNKQREDHLCSKIGNKQKNKRLKKIFAFFLKFFDTP